MNKAARIWAALAAPGAFWLLFFFAVPFYAVACVAFGSVDPIFRDAIPQWNPLNWSFGEFNAVFSSVTSGPLRGVFARTIVYVISAMIICFAIGFPVAYYLARHAGKRRMLLLLLIIAPFWVNYLMRMLAWVNLLSPSGLFSRFVGIFGVQYNWLDGSPITVILGLVYGYIPFLILPLYATLERLDWRLVEAARDLGATSRQAFRVVTVPMAKAGVAAAAILIALPMFGDYYTNDLLSRSPKTEMLGNQIDFYINNSSQPQRGAVLVIMLSTLLLVALSWYLRSTSRIGKERVR
ncbi:polyamine ABC transporter permease [Actinomycetes bacterium]|nr:polyamine ABC transporter permease [Actinomycetes bacterium]